MSKTLTELRRAIDLHDAATVSRLLGVLQKIAAHNPDAIVSALPTRQQSASVPVRAALVANIADDAERLAALFDLN